MLRTYPGLGVQCLLLLCVVWAEYEAAQVAARESAVTAAVARLAARRAADWSESEGEERSGPVWAQ